MIVALLEGKLWGVFPHTEAFTAAAHKVGYPTGRGQPKITCATAVKDYATFSFPSGGVAIFSLHIIPDTVGIGILVNSSNNTQL